MRLEEHVASMGEINMYKYFSGPHENNRRLGRPRRRRKDNIKLNVREIGF
jgi:hypothetical protein